MTLSYVAPPPILATELSEVRADAAALADFFKQLNAPLPDTFPKGALLEVANALRELPDGTARGCLRPLNEAQSQLAAIRSQHILHDEPIPPGALEHNLPLLRGEPLDQKLRHLMSSVSTALQTANRLAAEEAEPEAPEASIAPPDHASTAKLIENTSKAQSELEEERHELNTLSSPNSQHADTLKRRLTDAVILNQLGRSELRMPRIVSARLRRIGGALREYPKLLQQSAEAIAKGADVADYAYDKWHKLKERIFKAGTKTIREIAEDISTFAKKLEANRDRTAINPLKDPPADFDLWKAATMIHGGVDPPPSWKPFIDMLPLGSRKLRSLEPLRGLTNLRQLDKVSVRVSDISALSTTPALQLLDLSSTAVTDLTPIADLKALQTLHLFRTRVTDLTPLENLTSLRILGLNSTRVEDLAPLRNLSALRELHLDSTKVVDLSPIANLRSLEMLDLDRTQIKDLRALSRLPIKSLRAASAAIVDIGPLSSVATIRSLTLRGTMINDFTPLENLTQLEYLDLSETQFSDLKVLSRLKNLRTLHLTRTQITDLAQFPNLPKLSFVNLTDTSITDLKPLITLPSLDNLVVDNTGVSDLSDLSNAAKLRYLSLDGTKVTDLAPLASLQSLTSLSAEGTEISNLDPLVKLPMLSSLMIRGTKVKTIPPALIRRYLYIHHG